MDKIIKTRYYKNRGYILVDQEINANNMQVELKSAYSWPDLYYIGDSKTAYHYWKNFGICEFYPKTKTDKSKPLKINDKAKKMLLHGTALNLKKGVCSIGWSEKDQKWYGWSHRALYGFTIGSKTKKGYYSYQPKNKEESIENFLRFWDFDKDGNWKRPEYWDDNDNVVLCKITKIKHDVFDPNKEFLSIGTYIEYDTFVKDDRKVLHRSHFHQYPDKYGKGEWQAKTLDDAKQMAIDFSDGVS